jgi:hypothetical protein
MGEPTMALTFIGIDNPLGIVGLKQRGVIKSKEELIDIPATDKSGLASTATNMHAKETKQNRYQERINYFSEYKPEWLGKEPLLDDFTKETLKNRNFVVELLKQKAFGDFRVALCSSIDSLFKYLTQHFQNNLTGEQFDTLVIAGHGAANSMNVGLGRVGMPSAPPEKDDDDASKRIRTFRAMSGVDARPKDTKPGRTREISLGNQDRLTQAFAGAVAANALTVNDETGCFHVFLMACSVADEKGARLSSPFASNLVQIVAQNLSRAAKPLNLPVCVGAPAKGIYDADVFDLLSNLDAARYAGYHKKPYYLSKEVRMEFETV